MTVTITFFIVWCQSGQFFGGQALRRCYDRSWLLEEAQSDPPKRGPRRHKVCTVSTCVYPNMLLNAIATHQYLNTLNFIKHIQLLYVQLSPTPSYSQESWLSLWVSEPVHHPPSIAPRKRRFAKAIRSLFASYCIILHHIASYCISIHRSPVPFTSHLETCLLSSRHNRLGVAKALGQGTAPLRRQKQSDNGSGSSVIFNQSGTLMDGHVWSCFHVSRMSCSSWRHLHHPPQGLSENARGPPGQNTLRYEIPWSLVFCLIVLTC